MRHLVAFTLAAAWLLGASPAEAAVTVSHLEGSARVSHGKKAFKPLRKGAKVARGDRIKTANKTRLELSFQDGSRVRVGPGSDFILEDAQFTGRRRDAVSISLRLGRLWANVARATQGLSKFEVRTQNSVAGVRGTSFAVFAAADLSAIVRVYAGSVGVRSAIGETSTRKQVPGPREVDRQQWKETLATALKQVKISKLGDIAPATDLEPDTGSKAWAQWNQERDEAGP